MSHMDMELDEICKVQVIRKRHQVMLNLPHKAVKSMALSEHDKLRIRMIQDESEGDKLIISKVRLP